MRRKVKELSDKERIETLDALYTAAGTVQGREAMKLFLRDLLTPSERIMLGRRILIARKLISGVTYDEIARELKTGTDTVLKVSRWLDDQLPGYERVIAGMEAEFKKRKDKAISKKLYATSALYRLKKKYPLHFLLFPMPKLKEKE